VAEYTPRGPIPEACDGGADPSVNHEAHPWPCGDATALTEAEVRRVMTPLIGWPRIDRWLAEVRREAAEKAWDECWGRAESRAKVLRDGEPEPNPSRRGQS
jgi:hypothetical protein